MTFLYAGKIFTALATPLVFALVVLLAAAFSLRNARRPAGFRIVFAFAILLWVSCSGCTSSLLLTRLESPYAKSTIAGAPEAQAIVVLGGYLRYEGQTGRPVEIGGASDRLLCAFQLYRASKAPLILLSGGNLVSSSAVPPEADLASRILQEWGVPSSAILIEDRSRTTHENAIFSAPILAARGIQRILLVTSAFHMRRAAATFRRTNLNVLPFAADFLAEAGPPDFPFSLLPDAGAAVNSGIAVKEWLGLIAYRIRGWAD